MSPNLSVVRTTETGCLIQREVTGRYVVSHPSDPARQTHAATLAGAYAACQGWESRQLTEGNAG